MSPERVEQIAATPHDDDPRVSLATVGVLERLKAGRRALDRALHGARLSKQVRSAITQP